MVKEGDWLSKFGKLFPVFDLSVPKEELEKLKPQAKGESRDNSRRARMERLLS